MTLEWQSYDGPAPRALVGLGAEPKAHGHTWWMQVEGDDGALKTLIASPEQTVLTRGLGWVRSNRIGLGDAAGDAASAVVSYFATNPCSPVAIPVVQSFQSAYNASLSPTQANYQQMLLTVNGLFDSFTQSALATTLAANGKTTTPPTACFDTSGKYIGPAPLATTNNTIVSTTNTTLGMPTWLVWALGLAAVGTIGVVLFDFANKGGSDRRHHPARKLRESAAPLQLTERPRKKTRRRKKARRSRK
jgi:hypothetical protein